MMLAASFQYLVGSNFSTTESDIVIIISCLTCDQRIINNPDNATNACLSHLMPRC